ncbi:Uncharacterised protein [BD1-7 clade bacterium]|uniref:Mu-like prophage I protein n=1 Tax=BD1-7 clade bacterium TaxID=2029982 RepID=A0A5S9QU18_9GAMM|nr:Uncharacterised protein [BD1-7 clade bacterium]
MDTNTLALNFQIPALESEQPPEWLPLIPADTFTGRDQRTWHNPEPTSVIIATQAPGLDLPLDIEHATELKGPKGEKAEAYGWFPIAELENRNGVIWGRIEWNTEGRDLILGKKYRYYSPAFKFNAAGQVIRLVSVGLTNRSNLHELPALNRQSEEEPSMKLILAALGLAADADEATAVSTINTLQTQHQTALNRQAPDLTQYVPKETHQLALNRAEDAEQKLVNNQTEALENSAIALVDDGIENGKIAPANRDHFLGLCSQQTGFDQVKALLDTAPKVMAAEQKPKDALPNTQAGKLSAEELAVCSQLDLTEDEFIAVRDDA